ncbi:MAG: hypothetical protein WC503_03665 [Candidatus Shapirobacteria bacterium]
MDVTNEVIYVFFLTLSLILYHYSKKPFVYLFFGLLFLLRYESVVIPISVFIVEYYSKKPTIKIKNVLFSFIPIIIWLIVLNFHSRIGNSILGNAYIQEIFNGFKNIPNLSFFTHLIEIITFDSTYPNYQNTIFYLITIGLCLYGIANPKSKSLTKIIYLIYILNFLFISIFPNFAIRYYVPVIWITYFILANHKSRVFSFTILFCLLYHNLTRINIPTNHSRPRDMMEYRLVADWLNKYKSEKLAIIIVYESHILKYFVTNKNVFVPFDSETPFQECQEDIVCICHTLLTNINPKADVFVITTAYSSNNSFFANDQFTPTLHHVDIFKSKNFQGNSNFKYFTSVTSEDRNNWANFWQYIPSK